MANNFSFQKTLVTKLVPRLMQKSVYIGLTNRMFEQALKNDGIVDQNAYIDFRLPNYVGAFPDSDWSTAPDGNVVERVRQIKVDQSSNVKFTFNTDEMQFLAKHQFQERIVDPAADALGIKLDAALAKSLFVHAAYFTGTPGVKPATFQALSDTRSYMNQLGIPSNRNLVLSSPIHSSVISFAGFQNSFEVGRTKLINKEALIGRTAGFTMWEAPNAYYHIAGVGDVGAVPGSIYAGFVLAGNIKAKTFTIDATLEHVQLTLKNVPTTTAAFKVGDKIKILGSKIYSKSQQAVLQQDSQFTVLPNPSGVTNADYDPVNEWYNSGGTTSNEVTITISPAPIPLDEFSHLGDPNRAYATIDTALTLNSSVYLATANTGVSSLVKIPYACNMAYVPSAQNFGAPIPSLGTDKNFKADWNAEAIFLKEYGIGITTYSQGNIDLTIPAVLHRHRMQYAVKNLPEYSVCLFG